MNHWSKLVPIVELDPQSLLPTETHIVKKHIHYDVRWASRPMGLVFKKKYNKNWTKTNLNWIAILLNCSH